MEVAILRCRIHSDDLNSGRFYRTRSFCHRQWTTWTPNKGPRADLKIAWTHRSPSGLSICSSLCLSFPAKDTTNLAQCPEDMPSWGQVHARAGILRTTRRLIP